MIDLDKVERLMAMMAQYGVDVVEAESGRERVSLARHAADAHFFNRVNRNPAVAGAQYAGGGGLDLVQPGGAEPVASAAPSKAGSSNPVASVASTPSSPSVAGFVQKSELVGTFYRSPSPGTPPFTEVGKVVKKGQTLCIVEAMKIMNEIESEADGEVLEILVQDGKPVEFGTPLFVIKNR
jgi:acetyl-CoA carboxylase biotin carboxyl carrier protein